MTLLLWLFNYIPLTFVYIMLAVGVALFLLAEVVSIKTAFASAAAIRILAILLMALSIFFMGISYSEQEFKKQIDKMTAEITRIQEEAKQITQQVVIKYIYRDKIIKEKGDEIIKYVNTKNDADCNLHNSTIELLNSAAKNDLPNPATATDDTGSGVKLSTVEATVIENYNKYYQLKNKNDLLQEWIREQQKNNNK